MIPLYAPLRELLAHIPKRATTVLTSSRRRPWTSNGFQSSFNDSKINAKMDKLDLHFHDLRGTAATKFYIAGIEIRVSFIASILDQGIGLVCAEMPNATDFQLHIFAALAQEERRLISERTKAALAEAKCRGKILGANGRNLAAKNRRSADDFASQLDADLLRSSYSEIARHLSGAGIATVTGRKFYPQR